MRTLASILLFTIGFFVVAGVAVSRPSAVQSLPLGKAEKLKIRSSIQCEKCIQRIDAELPRLKGVQSVKYDLTKKHVIVRYKPTEVTPDQIREALTKIGYDADNLPADPEAYQKLPVCCKKRG